MFDMVIFISQNKQIFDYYYQFLLLKKTKDVTPWLHGHSVITILLNNT